MSDVPRQEAERARIEEAYRQRDVAQASAAYSFANPAYVFGAQELEWTLLAALREARVPLEGRVLDVGCGSGYYLHRLSEYGATDAVGIELIEDRVAAASRRYPLLDVRQGDASALPFADESFDVVTQFTVLSSILDPVMRNLVAREMWRVARRGGVVVSVDMIPPPALRRLIRAVRRTGPPTGVTPIQGLTPHDVVALFPTTPAVSRMFGYHMGLGPLVTRSRLASQLLVRLRPAHTHLVAVFRKP